MLEMIKHKFALSDEGAKDMIKACISAAISDFILMGPAGILYMLIEDMLAGKIESNKIYVYIAWTLVVLALITITQFNQYNATFLSTYKESGIRRITIAEKLRKMPLSYFGKKDLSDLTTSIMSDCAMIETASSHFIPQLFGSLISTTIVGIMLFFFDYRMALASFWVIPVSIAIVLLSGKVQKRAVKKQEAVKLDFSSGIQEYLEVIRDLKANNAGEAYKNELNNKIKNVEKGSLITEFTMATFVASAQMILKLGIGSTALVGGILFASGEIDVVKFFMFLMIVSRLYDPMVASLQNISAIIATDVNCDRLDEILSHDIQTGEEKLSNNGYDVEFSNVKFSYENGEQVLSDVSFVAKQGEVTALIGPSGGGKTTVSRLAARFWDINEGKISVGGMDISKIDPETLLSMYSIVFQDVTLFNTSVMENIRLGRKGASDEEVMEAAKLANCMEFIEKLSDGFDTVIGENGKNLSGGERQRISIARAFLKDAPIILLDEATASLDVENETLIQEALSKLIENKTVLIIAHRMRTIANANKIVVLKDGIVAESGSPDYLREIDGIYSHMIQLQNVSDNWKMA
ncbi:MAG: ABC transporter ATP-binding protein/permease [Lachnospiraceae bacterium]|nr:ABC transporter ATP-binding protein/permease [Lachnospiraceae bacterium]